MTMVYLAIVAPDDQGPTIVGAFSTLEAAQEAHRTPGEWDYSRIYGQWWQRNPNGVGYNDNEVHPLELDERTQP
jgi:hypothetical protein